MCILHHRFKWNHIGWVCGQKTQHRQLKEHQHQCDYDSPVVLLNGTIIDILVFQPPPDSPWYPHQITRCWHQHTHTRGAGSTANNRWTSIFRCREGHWMQRNTGLVSFFGLEDTSSWSRPQSKNKKQLVVRTAPEVIFKPVEMVCFEHLLASSLFRWFAEGFFALRHSCKRC